MSLAGKTALITGGSRGIGFAIAQAYVAAGARVMICARDAEALIQAQNILGCLIYQADIRDQNQVYRLMNWAIAQLQPIGILVNAAGIAGPTGVVEACDLTDTIETNLMGAVSVMQHMLKHLKERKGGCIVQLSGGGVTKPLPYRTAYAASKAAIVAACASIAEEVKDDGITVNCLAPGSINTDMNPDGTDSIDRAAACAVFLGDNPPFTGKLISAQWDDWQHLPANLNDSNLYTLRRVVRPSLDDQMGMLEQGINEFKRQRHQQ